jgi:RNA polymerase sigma-70 factor, ECF subfamily
MKGERIESLGAWVTTAAMNLARSRRRRAASERRATGRLSAVADPPRGGLELTEQRVDLLHAVERLPRRQREVVALHYFMDMDVSRVGAVLGVSEGAVKQLLFRARGTIGAALKEPEEGVGDVQA